MHIICPHCTTSYAIDLATLGAAGRTVRCSRCKEVWLARPEDAIEAAPAPAMAEADEAAAAEAAAAQWDARAAAGNSQDQEIPVVESPSISSDWPASADAGGAPRGRRRLAVGSQDDGDDWRKPRGAHAAAVMVPETLETAGACFARRANHSRAFRPPAPPWARWCWR